MTGVEWYSVVPRPALMRMHRIGGHVGRGIGGGFFAVMISNQPDDGHSSLNWTPFAGPRVAGIKV